MEKLPQELSLLRVRGLSQGKSLTTQWDLWDEQIDLSRCAQTGTVNKPHRPQDQVGQIEFRVFGFEWRAIQ
jgi:hypothetical protein